MICAALAEAVQGWSNVNTVWRDKEEDMPIVGHIDEDGFKYPVLTVDTAQYFDEKDDLAQFYAAANPATIIALVAKVESLAADTQRLDLMIRHGSSNGQFIWIEQKSNFIDPRGRIAGIGDDQRSALDAAMAKEKA